MLGVAPTSAGDGYGVAFADATSFDNRYVLDGIDTTNVRDGGNDTWLPHELVGGVGVLSGGGDAAITRYPGATISAIARTT